MRSSASTATLRVPVSSRTTSGWQAGSADTGRISARRDDVAKCWCGDDHEPTCPTCGKCGAPVETGMMVFFCPKRTACEFYSEDLEEGSKEMLAQIWKNQDERASGSA